MSVFSQIPDVYFRYYPTYSLEKNKMPYPRILERLHKSAQQGGKRNNEFENLKI
jgi:hypothetical protein